uniref:Uncharacterized protein n=1 Tax=Ananas comosus var. bracteatus TaxID=296719 RepID=A0A6V7P583_ANACO|nr:unnamed protein product [Ananas comosus var. bracteatus]
MSSSASSSTWKMEKVTDPTCSGSPTTPGQGDDGRRQAHPIGHLQCRGFNWTLACFLDGQDEHCAGWMSLVLRLETDAVPVRALLKLSLLDPQRSCPFTRTIIDVFAKQHSGRGIGKFIRRADFETSQFLRDDCFAVHCAVTVVKSPLGGLCFISSTQIPALVYGRATDDDDGVLLQFDGSAPSRCRRSIRLERLRLVCEYKLCRNIRVNTVANTLALAEQHRCGRLKAACLNFIASPGRWLRLSKRMDLST